MTTNIFYFLSSWPKHLSSYQHTYIILKVIITQIKLVDFKGKGYVHKSFKSIKEKYGKERRRQKLDARYVFIITIRAEGTDGDEYIITRLDHVIPAINIVTVYGDQESRVGKDSILSSWLRLKTEERLL